MGVLTIEGIVDNGQIKLTSGVRLPEHTRVFVVVPDMKIEQTAHMLSPHLKNPNGVADFEMEVFEESADANLSKHNLIDKINFKSTIEKKDSQS